MSRSPLFDIYDPSGIIQDQARQGFLPRTQDEFDPIGLVPFGPRRATLSDLMPKEEQQSLLRQLASHGASGLSTLGYLLDYPGSFVRGALAGKPMSTFGSSDERVSGRDLLRQYGLIGNKDTWTNFALGTGVEILTDPLTYLNPLATLGKGALLKSGRAAEKSGLLEGASLLARKQGKGIREFLQTTTPAELATLQPGSDHFSKFANAATGMGLDAEELWRQPMSALMEARIPGTKGGIGINFGGAGPKIARGLDQFGEFLKTNPVTAPVTNRLRATFDPSVINAINPEQQWERRQLFLDRNRAVRNEMELLAEQQRAADKVTLSGADDSLSSFNAPRIQNAIRDTVEANGDPEKLAAIADQDAVRALHGVPEWRSYRDFAIDYLEEAKQRADSLGLQLPSAKSREGTGFFPAQSIWWNNPLAPDLPNRIARQESPYTRGSRLLNIDDNLGRSRADYTDLDRRSETFRRLMGGDFGRDLQSRLNAANDEAVPGIIDEAFQNLGLETPYQKAASGQPGIQEYRDLLATNPVNAKELQEKLDQLLRDANAKKLQLGELLRRADLNFANTNTGLFDSHTVNDMARYATGRTVAEANSRLVTQKLIENSVDVPFNQVAGGGQKNLLDAAAGLGYNRSSFKKLLEARFPGEDVTRRSVNEKVLQDLAALSPARPVQDQTMLQKAWNSYTNLFKVLALANPSYHTRNLYSGALATVSAGVSPLGLAGDYRAGYHAARGNYDPLYELIKDAPGYGGALSKDEAIDKFLREAARNGLSQGLVHEADNVVEQAARSLYPGGDTRPPIKFYDKNRTWPEWLTVRGVGGLGEDAVAPSQTLNPLLQLHEAAGRSVEDAARLGAYISQIRKGVSPDAAADLVYKTQVDYRPQAFTDTERYIKSMVPFYSYTRGIAPLVADNILYRPGGVQGQVTRAINRGAESNDEFFTPEHLRQSAAIPLPAELGGNPAEGLQRFVTNIDMPWEGLINLYSPGHGNTAAQQLTSTVQKTGMNLLGQLNPLPKSLLEFILNRQLYSGRELSDLYSVGERDLGPWGRPLEHLLVNLPGGTKLNSIYRTATDKRLSRGEALGKIAINNLLGLKVTDVDQERTKRLAARQMLNELLETTPGVRTYENITVPDDVLRSMPDAQRKQYLLYRIVQAEAAARARDRKKREAALDPMQVLGVTGSI